MILRALQHPVIWFRSYRRALVRPLKFLGWVLLPVSSAFVSHLAHTEYKLSAMMRPMFGELADLSSSHTSGREISGLGTRWEGRFVLREKRMGHQSYEVIRKSLRFGGWSRYEETTTPPSGINSYLIRAEKRGYTLVARLTETGTDLRVDVMKSAKAGDLRSAENEDF